MAAKELRQLVRDRRTVAMLVFLPLLLIVVFGYAASFNVNRIAVTAVGPGAEAVAARLPAPFVLTGTVPGGRAAATAALRDGRSPAAVTVDAGIATVYVDGSQLFTAQAVLRAVGDITARRALSLHAIVLFNPDLRTSDVMVPGLAGLILLFIGTVITSLGVVRERQSGTLEQLAIMPLRPWDVFVGKIAPYFGVSVLDMVIVVAVAVALFHVPFVGSVWVFGLGALLFMFAALGIGVVISTVSQNQGQAIQLAIMTLLPQIMLSGLIFPLSSMAVGVRWIGYALPLSYFVEIARDVMLRGAPIGALWEPLVVLGGIGTLAVVVATLRFRHTLGPPRVRRRAAEAGGP